MAFKFKLNTEKMNLEEGIIKFYNFKKVGSKPSYTSYEREKEQILYSLFFQNAYNKTGSVNFLENDLVFKKEDYSKLMNFYQELDDKSYTIFLDWTLNKVGGFDNIMNYAKSKGLVKEEGSEYVPTTHLLKLFVDNCITKDLEEVVSQTGKIA